MISKEEYEHYNINNDSGRAPHCYHCLVGLNPLHGGDSFHIVEQVSAQQYFGKINAYRRLYFCVPCFTYIAGDRYKVALK